MVGHFAGIDTVEDGVETGVFEFGDDIAGEGLFFVLEELVEFFEVGTVFDDGLFEVAFGVGHEEGEIAIGAAEFAAFEVFVIFERNFGQVVIA